MTQPNSRNHENLITYGSLTAERKMGLERDNPRPYVVVRGGYRTVAIDLADLDETIDALIVARRVLSGVP